MANWTRVPELASPKGPARFSGFSPQELELADRLHVSGDKNMCIGSRKWRRSVRAAQKTPSPHNGRKRNSMMYDHWNKIVSSGEDLDEIPKGKDVVGVSNYPYLRGRAYVPGEDRPIVMRDRVYTSDPTHENLLDVTKPDLHDVCLYHFGNLSRDQCENVLADCDVGTFLVRVGSQGHVLSVRVRRRTHLRECTDLQCPGCAHEHDVKDVAHVRIDHQDGMSFRIDRNRRYASVRDLVQDNVKNARRFFLGLWDVTDYVGASLLPYHVERLKHAFGTPCCPVGIETLPLQLANEAKSFLMDILLCANRAVHCGDAEYLAPELWLIIIAHFDNTNLLGARSDYDKPLSTRKLGVIWRTAHAVQTGR